MDKPSLKTLHPDAFELIAARFRVLSDPLRLRLLRELEGGEKKVGDLVAALGASQPSVSKHLKLLLGAGLVGRRQEGPAAYYHIADPAISSLCELVCSSLEGQMRYQAEQALRLLGADNGAAAAMNDGG